MPTGAGTAAEYFLDIQYRYEVAGVAYVGTDFRDGENQPSEPQVDAQYRAALYPVGRRTLVSYNPNEPWVAVLEPHDRGSLHAMIAGGTALVLGGLWLLL